jgi:hypothetical protein
MNKFISSALYLFNRLNPVALIVVVLSIFYIGFQLNFNEEVYFAFSKAYVDPQWIPNSTLFTDFAGTRILFQLIFGWILKFISFEHMAFFGRLLGYVLLAMPFAAIAKHLKINNLVLVFWLTIFFVPQQSFFAGEWVFGGFETKTIAYVFVFWSIWFLFREKFLPAVIFAAISVYWHMLVGGWYTLYLFIYLLITIGREKRIYLYWFYAGLILLPFVIYIYLGLMSGNENVINGVNIGRLYAYDRNPHHIGLVKSWDYFLHRHAGKVGMGCIAYLIAIFAYRKRIPTRFKWVNTFLIIILSQNLLFLIVALFDTNGFIAKFYPWRGSALAMLFFQMATLIMIRYIWMPPFYRFINAKFNSIARKTFYSVSMGLALFISIVALSLTVAGRLETTKSEKPGWIELDAMTENLKTLSKPGDMFMLFGDENFYNVAIPRKAERDIYYMFRVIPSQTHAIYDWYCRGLEQEKVKSDVNYLVKSGLDKKINFIVSTYVVNAPFLEQVYASPGYRIYKVIR